jgi:hypothetical protein
MIDQEQLKITMTYVNVKNCLKLSIADAGVAAI